MLNRFASYLCVAVLSGLAFATPFPDHCDHGKALPFASIEQQHPIDQSCGLPGKTSSSANSHTQNLVKNNFCAEGQPEDITPSGLLDLQHKTTVPSGQGKEPSSRDALTQLGEGKLVRLKGYLIEAHHADLGSGESVNCSGTTESTNDVHIALGDDPDTEECNSVSAEISPHYRPASWNEIGHYEKYDSHSHQYVPNAAKAAILRSQPYRITGQLFFDASHEVCTCASPCNPIRESGWEIHPVYAIDVCKSGTSCDEKQDSDWVAFDKWWAKANKVKGPHSHSEGTH